MRAPDFNSADSIQIEPLDERALSKRRKRFRLEAASQLELIPAEWQRLLVRWVKRGGNEPVLHFWNAKTGAAMGTVDLPERPGRGVAGPVRERGQPKVSNGPQE